MNLQVQEFVERSIYNERLPVHCDKYKVSFMDLCMHYGYQTPKNTINLIEGMNNVSDNIFQ